MTSWGHLTLKTKMTIATMMTLWCWSREFSSRCEMWNAGQGGWFHHVRRNLSLDVDRFWPRLKNSYQCLRLCQRPNQKENNKVLRTREDKTLTFEKKNPAIVMLVGVSCINFHSFALGILFDEKQKNHNPTDGLYTLPTNSTSFQVSAIRQ